MLRSMLAISLLMLFGGCGSGQSETILDVSFFTQPQNASSTASVSAVLKVERKGKTSNGITAPGSGAKPIDITVQWWWQNAYGAGDHLLQEETFHITQNSQTITTAYSRVGFYLLNFHWVKVSWRDEDKEGTLREVESSKAYLQGAGG